MRRKRDARGGGRDSDSDVQVVASPSPPAKRRRRAASVASVESVESVASVASVASVESVESVASVESESESASAPESESSPHRAHRAHRARRFVGIDIGTRNFSVDLLDAETSEHQMYLLDLLVQRDPRTGRWCRFKMEERLAPDLVDRLVSAFDHHLRNADMVGIEGQMRRNMAVLGMVLQAVIEERYPNLPVVKLAAPSVRKYLGAKLGTDLAGSGRQYEESKDAGKRTVEMVLGAKRWAKYARAFRKVSVDRRGRRKTEVRIDPGDAMLMTLYMRDNYAKLLRNRRRAPVVQRSTANDFDRPVRVLRLTVPA